ncbi:MAG TPA: methanogenesis marker protein Mmp4/MtxX [Candidatus Methanoperedenaceae archaeon]|nr:methanogenesis marker protein Mmp4/MtxX [Candidatus Methanoperedenaceae archaeon]
MAMLLAEIEKRARERRARIGIGVSTITESMYDSLVHAGEFADVVLVGDRKKISRYRSKLEIVDSPEPHRKLVDMLIRNEIDGAVRGTLSATKTLSALKAGLGVKKLHRVALLETAAGTPFFLAPVGIDEGSSVDEKIELVRRGAACMRRFGVEPVIGVLSGGRIEDRGRDSRVDISLLEAQELTDRLVGMGFNAKNYAILIEDAVKGANLIVAPDGISGNLIFRTLVFLGGGKGHGAPVLIKQVFVDTSRVNEDFTNAIMLASALAWRR